ncbi:MAG: FHA domain-containing protein [Planctomycetota bacterium]
MLKAKLVVVGGDAKRREVNLKSLPCVIGRAKEATLTLPHPLVSRRHTELFEKEGQLWVRDLGSLNGTFLNNERLETEQLLAPNQLLTLGNVTFRAVYEVEDAQATDSVPAETLREDQQDTSDTPVTDIPDFAEVPDAGLSGLSAIDASGLSALDMLTTQPVPPVVGKTERAPERIVEAAPIADVQPVVEVQPVEAQPVVQEANASPAAPAAEEVKQIDATGIAEPEAQVEPAEPAVNVAPPEMNREPADEPVELGTEPEPAATEDAASEDDSTAEDDSAAGESAEKIDAVVDLDSGHTASESSDTDKSLLTGDGESRISIEIELDEQPSAQKSISLSSLDGLGSLEDASAPAAAASFSGFQIVDEESAANPESVVEAVQLDLGEESSSGTDEDDDKGLESFIRNLPR